MKSQYTMNVNGEEKKEYQEERGGISAFNGIDFSMLGGTALNLD